MSRPTFVVAFNGPGANYPAALPSRTTIRDFHHDGDGGTFYLYDFADADLAANFAALVRGAAFADEGEAINAYRAAIGG